MSIKKERNSGPKKRHEQPSQAHSILSVTSLPPKMATAKEANTPKDACFESGTDMQEKIAKFKPSDPSVTTRKSKNSGFTKTHD